MLLIAVVSTFPCSAATQERLGPLITTHWSQRGPYAEFTPDHNRLGCWSVAFAQIFYYHRVSPTGQRSYQGSQYLVTANFGSPKVNLDLVLPEIKTDSPQAAAQETARYLWYAAVVTGADFGRGNYVGGVSLKRIEKFYRVSTQGLKVNETPRAEVEDFMRNELTRDRPLFLYIAGSTQSGNSTGHAVVIDGIERKGDALGVHVNFGHGGKSDNWYPFWQPICNFDNHTRWLVAIRPRSKGSAEK